MGTDTVNNIWTVAKPFDETLRWLRQVLPTRGLSVVQEIDLKHEFRGQVAVGAGNGALLLVDCPLLMFEALALDPSAAAFIPLHLVVVGDRHSSTVHWAHPAGAMGLRAQPAARGPVNALYSHLTRALKEQ